MELYRYRDTYYHGGQVHIDLEKYEVLRETPKGYWISRIWDYLFAFNPIEYKERTKKWVKKHSFNSFAYTSKEAARRNFIARKRTQIKILESQLNQAKAVFSKISRDDFDFDLVDRKAESRINNDCGWSLEKKDKEEINVPIREGFISKREMNI